LTARCRTFWSQDRQTSYHMDQSSFEFQERPILTLGNQNEVRSDVIITSYFRCEIVTASPAGGAGQNVAFRNRTPPRGLSETGRWLSYAVTFMAKVRWCYKMLDLSSPWGYKGRTRCEQLKWTFGEGMGQRLHWQP
jgi:hypothetical protein